MQGKFPKNDGYFVNPSLQNDTLSEKSLKLVPQEMECLKTFLYIYEKEMQLRALK